MVFHAPRRRYRTRRDSPRDKRSALFYDMGAQRKSYADPTFHRFSPPLLFDTHCTTKVSMPEKSTPDTNSTQHNTRRRPKPITTTDQTNQLKPTNQSPPTKPIANRQNQSLPPAKPITAGQANHQQPSQSPPSARPIANGQNQSLASAKPITSIDQNTHYRPKPITTDQNQPPRTGQTNQFRVNQPLLAKPIATGQTNHHRPKTINYRPNQSPPPGKPTTGQEQTIFHRSDQSVPVKNKTKNNLTSQTQKLHQKYLAESRALRYVYTIAPQKTKTKTKNTICVDFIFCFFCSWHKKKQCWWCGDHPCETTRRTRAGTGRVGPPWSNLRPTVLLHQTNPPGRPPVGNVATTTPPPPLPPLPPPPPPPPPQQQQQ